MTLTVQSEGAKYFEVTFSVDVIIRFIPVKILYGHTKFEVACGRKTWNEIEKSLIQGQRLHDFPANQSNILILWSTFFSSRNTCSIRLVNDLQRPKKQYPERPRAVSTVYFHQSTEYW